VHVFDWSVLFFCVELLVFVTLKFGEVLSRGVFYPKYVL